jgi:phosphoglycolate phosphatase
VSFTVGFDLDMTLIDPRQGIAALFDVLSGESGVPLDGVGFAGRLGPPLEDEFARYNLPASTIETLVTRFRELYQEVVLPATVPLPGAVEALDAVYQRGGRVVVVTGKFQPNAVAHLQALGIHVDAVIGRLWSSGKAVALREHAAEVYVGDHIGDMMAAREADALAVAVATGPIDAQLLSEAGADVVLPDLRAFPQWLHSYLLATVH